MNVQDISLKVTKALPADASTVTSDAIDLGVSTNSDFVAQCELYISAPALATADLGDAATMKYNIIHSDNSDLSSPTTLVAAAITQTGAGGAGAAAATYRYRFPSTVKRYVGVSATNSAAGDASDKSFTAQILF